MRETSNETLAATAFPRDVAEHEMTVLRDDGLYRHLRFQKPSTYVYWFEVVTWPGTLTIRGDMGTFVFARLTDMFEFFRPERPINPGYWAEKLQAGSTEGVKVWSPEAFAAHVKESFDEWAEGEDRADDDRADEWQLVESVVLDHADDEREAMSALRLRGPLLGPHDPFQDAWEWDCREWTVQYLWCCHAILWAVARYEAGRAP